MTPLKYLSIQSKKSLKRLLKDYCMTAYQSLNAS